MQCMKRGDFMLEKQSSARMNISRLHGGAGEMIVGPKRVLFMDEISTGLDSSTTFAIIKYLRDATHNLRYTTAIALLQPAPETYDLFDDIILIAEGAPR